MSALSPIRASLVRVGAERNEAEAIGAGGIWQPCDTCRGVGLVHGPRARVDDGPDRLCDDCEGAGGETIEQDAD